MRSLPKYEYPLEVLTASALNQMSRYGVDFKVDNNDVAFTRQLDAQKEAQKVIFGAGFYLSEKAAAEKAAAEKWALSDREKSIIKSLA